MKAARALYHMARADFLERTRRYSFLIMLGLIVWLGYLVNTGALTMSVPPDYVGEVNSPWVGALMTVTVGLFLGWFGFYLVKGSVSRDYETGVGQILATTPLSRPLYALGKWVSNFAVLAIMMLILMAAGVGMVLLVGRAPLELWPLVSPLLFVGMPLMALVAALAVLFEMVSWLRGGFGNILYWFLFLLMVAPGMELQPYRPLLDFTGMRLVADGIFAAAQADYPGIERGFSFQGGQTISSPHEFHFQGVPWSSDLLLPRLIFLLMAVGLVMLAALFFDRFNSAKSRGRRKTGVHPASLPADGRTAASISQARLAPLQRSGHFRLPTLFAAELRMLLKGHRWWWYVVGIGLLIAQLAAAADSIPLLLAASWFWMILLLSGLGNREAQENTREMVFSAPRPIANQLPALWLAAIAVMALAGSGAFVRYMLAGDVSRLLAWFGGVLFVPALASAMGALTLSRKPFEVVYVTWMYVVLNGVAPLDFVGITPASPWHVFALLAVGLFALTALARWLQLTEWNILRGSGVLRG